MIYLNVFEAPETVTDEVPHPTQKTDVWQLGLVFYHILHRKMPYQRVQDEEVDFIKALEFFQDHEILPRELEQRDANDISEDKKKPYMNETLILWMLTKDLEKRPNIKQVLRHPLIRAHLNDKMKEFYKDLICLPESHSIF